MCRNPKRALTSSKRQQKVPWWRRKEKAQPVPLQTRALRTTGFDEGVSYHPRRIQLKLPATIGSVSETVSFPCPHRRLTLLCVLDCAVFQPVSQFLVGRQPFFGGALSSCP